MNWENLGILKMLAMIAPVFITVLLLGLWFGGILGNKKRPVALFILVAIIALAIIVGGVTLQALT